MVNIPHISFNANDRSYLAIVKKEIHKIAVQGAFDPQKLNEIDLIVAELGSNLIKHATGGEILAAIIQVDGGIALELISIDNGPGIADPDKMVMDGISTTQTLGHGLGSIRRFSDTFEIYTKKGWGTILLSRINNIISSPKKIKKIPIHLQALIIAKP